MLRRLKTYTIDTFDPRDVQYSFDSKKSFISSFVPIFVILPPARLKEISIYHDNSKTNLEHVNINEGCTFVLEWADSNVTIMTEKFEQMDEMVDRFIAENHSRIENASSMKQSKRFTNYGNTCTLTMKQKAGHYPDIIRNSTGSAEAWETLRVGTYLQATLQMETIWIMSNKNLYGHISTFNEILI